MCSLKGGRCKALISHNVGVVVVAIVKVQVVLHHVSAPASRLKLLLMLLSLLKVHS